MAVSPELLSASEMLDEAADWKQELSVERRGSLIISVYWLKLTNEVSLQLLDLGTGELKENLIPNDRVRDAIDHPYTYIDRPIS